MARYTYYIADVRTGTVLGDLPFADVSMSWLLSGAGTFEGTLKLTDPDVIAQGALTLTQEGRNAVYVDRDGDLIWSGVIWATKRDSAGKLSVTAADYWSYFARRICNVDVVSPSIDLVPLAQAIFAPALDAYKPANLTVAYVTPSGGSATPTPITYEYRTADDRKSVAALIEDLAEGDPGIDFRLQAEWTTYGLAASLRVVVGRPWIGEQVVTTGAYFDFPGNVQEWEEDRDGSGLVARLFVKGSAEGESAAPEVVLEDTSLYNVYPRYEDVETVDDTNSSLVDARGRARFAKRKVVKTVRTLKVRGDVDPQVGTYRVGDYCTFRVTDSGSYPSGAEFALRIGEIKLSPKNEAVDITPWSPDDGTP